jgi:hypothetical protein
VRQLDKVHLLPSPADIERPLAISALHV